MQTRMMRTVMNDIQPVFEKVLSPFADHSVGPYLRYDPVYDQIRDALREEDNHLSQGVWQIELKKAAPREAEKLCTQALTAQSKDLQIVCWLAESWFLQNGLEGFLQGLRLIHVFAKNYWETMHPLDYEHRLRLFEWMDGDFTKYLHMFPLTVVPGSAKQYSLQDHILAHTFDQALRRDPENSQKQIERAHKRGDPLLPHVMGAFEQTSPGIFKEGTEKIQDLEETLKAFKTLLEEKLGKETPTFSRTLNALRDMKRIIEVPDDIENKIIPETSAERAVEHETKSSVKGSTQMTKFPAANIETRSDAYRHLQTLADIFAKLEPHSPTANALHKISKWENKQLVDILGDFSKTPEAITVFMNFISKE